MASIKQIKANRINAIKGGPRTAAGKSISRRNALKHGVLASALTPYDEPQFRAFCDALVADLKPVGPAEEMLTDMIAQNYLRLQRCARAEAECHIKTWEPSIDSYDLERHEERKKAGLHTTWFDLDKFTESVELFSRYNTALTNHILRLMRELDRLQQMRPEEGLALTEPEVSPTLDDPLQPSSTPALSAAEVNAAPEPPPASPVPESHPSHEQAPASPNASSSPFPNEPNLPHPSLAQSVTAIRNPDNAPDSHPDAVAATGIAS